MKTTRTNLAARRLFPVMAGATAALGLLGCHHLGVSVHDTPGGITHTTTTVSQTTTTR
jgi:hypothetical protein